MIKRKCTLVFLASLLILGMIPLWGAHVHHSPSCESKINFCVISQEGLVNCGHTTICCVAQCDEETVFEHLFENGAVLSKSDSNYKKIKRKSDPFNFLLNYYKLFSDEYTSPFVTNSAIPSELYLFPIQTSRAPPTYS
ncbi:MAG: hypothetical protein SVR08_07665 [Spirochaetota bacterium]|nr:hypothetical protein [Spirochaetota bacterium]